MHALLFYLLPPEANKKQQKEGSGARDQRRCRNFYVDEVMFLTKSDGFYEIIDFFGCSSVRICRRSHVFDQPEVVVFMKLSIFMGGVGPDLVNFDENHDFGVRLVLLQEVVFGEF